MIKLLEKNEIPAAMDLVWQVFSEFEAPEYLPEGVKTFRDFIANEDEINKLKIYGTFVEDSLAGIIALRGGEHICLFFVRKEHHRQGLGRSLFEFALRDGAADKITVNSSPYAVEVYHKLGFADTDTEQVLNGIRFTPMVFEKT